METQNERVNRRCLKILFCSFVLLVFAVVTTWYVLGEHRFLQKEKKVHRFIGQIINSALDNTDFYRNNSRSRIIKDIDNCRDLMSNRYTISLIDYSWGIYEAKILFDNKISIKVDITFRDNKPFLSHFRKLKE